jgi:hypothetical protein
MMANVNQLFDDDVLSPSVAVEALVDQAEQFRSAGFVAFGWPRDFDFVRTVAHDLLAIEPEIDFDAKSRKAIAAIETQFGNLPAREAEGMVQDVVAFPNARKGVQAYLAALVIASCLERLAWASAAPSN